VTATTASAPSWRRVVRVAWLVVVVVVAAVVLARRWGEVAPVLADLRPVPLVVAAAAGMLAVGLSAGIWRSVLAGLGSPLPVPAVTTVFFVTQLGKYLPGAVWPLVAQMELARDYLVLPRVSAAALALFTWVHLATGVMAAVLLLPLGGVLPPAAALLAVICAILLVPAPLVRLIDWGLRLVRRDPLPRRPGAGTMVRASGWALAMWVGFGVHIAALGGAAGESLGVAYAIGVFAAGWVVGFVVLVAPAGVGAREAAFTAVLVPQVGTGAALAIVLVSRLLLVVTDAAWAGAGLVLRRLR
jgi:glycosyltransferase 2 family protein